MYCTYDRPCSVIRTSQLNVADAWTRHQRCLGANTQNNNESFNACVWNLAPKHVFTGKKKLEIATFTAACIFNEGLKSSIKIMELMGVTIGPQAIHFMETHDEARITKAELCSTAASKEARAALRAARAEENDAFGEAEGLLYGVGIV